MADTALSEVELTTAVATVAAADALRKVLQAQEQLVNRCSETSLTQLIAVLRDTSPELQQARWLLVTQQETYKSQARICELLVVWLAIVFAQNKLCKLEHELVTMMLTIIEIRCHLQHDTGAYDI